MTSIIEEIKLHCQLLKINKKDLRGFFSSPYLIILIAIFSILFLPHAFVVVKDINFVLAYEVDPGSIIDSILSMYKNLYNMNAGYHSKYYGWTYYWISFILLAPIYFVEKVILSGNLFAFFIGTRLLFFLIGLLSVLAFYRIIVRIFRNKLVGLIGGLLYISSPVISKYFYFLHPESTGLLFLFLGILCLLNFRDSEAKEHRWYTIGLLSLTLSALSKHPFILPAISVLGLFLITYFYYQRVSLIKFLFSWRFVKLLLITIGLPLLVFFVINPYAFLEPRVFLKYQLGLTSNQLSSTSLTFFQGLNAWISIIRSLPVILISIILAPVSIVMSLVRSKDKLGKSYYVVNIITAILFIVVFSILSRFIIDQMYFAPIYPLFILNLLSISLFIINELKQDKIKNITVAIFSALVLVIIIGNFNKSLPAAFKRLNYKRTTIYQTYNYIEKEIPEGSRIAYDHFVAIPSNKDFESCHYWRGCGTDYIEEFNPNYVIFNMKWTFGGSVHLPTQRLIDYIQDHNMTLDEVIGGDSSYQVWVWKKP